jgi:carbamate kinase
VRLVVALGGNALLRRDEPMTAEAQRANVQRAAAALAPLAREHELVVTHGNGPQIGLLALQQALPPGARSGAAPAAPAVAPSAGAATASVGFPLDVLGAQTEGMIGYLLEQALDEVLPPGKLVASLLTRVLVDAADPAFASPTKFVGPGYASEAETRALADRLGWTFRRDGDRLRRVVPSPRPVEILELPVLEILLERGVTVVCAGGGGIPVCRDGAGREIGVEAVIDKDHASALLARKLGADALVLLTDVGGVSLGFGTPAARGIRRASPALLAPFAEREFPPGSMGPKVAAACEFVAATGGFAAIGALEAVCEVLAGRRGTRIERDVSRLELESA